MASLLTPFDRGLQYGDGLFETIAVIGKHMPLWSRHYQRLQLGCQCLGIMPPDERALLNDIEQLLTGEGGRSVIKLIVTRGNSYGGYVEPEDSKPHSVIMLRPWPSYVKPWHLEGVQVRTCTLQESFQPALAGIKHLNRLESVLARREWDNSDIQEGILLDQEGYVVEGTASNFFMVKGGVLHTPMLDRCGVDGVMRQFSIALASQLGYAVQERRITLDECRQADEMFLTSAVHGIWPIKAWGSVKTLKIWEVTVQLQLSLEEKLGLWNDLR